MSDDLLLISLIHLVEIHSCLWNTRCKDYNKPEAIGVAWKDIAERMNDSEQNCRERWKNVRCAYVRSLKPYKSGKTKRPYYLSDVMSFLLPHLKAKDYAGTSRIVKPEIIDVKTEEETDEDVPRETKRTKMAVEPAINVEMAPERHYLDEDADSLFLRSLLPDLRKLDERRKRILKSDIIKSLYSLLDQQEEGRHSRMATREATPV